MITRTPIGVSFFDNQYGGVYSGRAVLVSGRAGTGKTVFSLQFVLQGIRQGERCLILSTNPAGDLILFAEGLEMPIGGTIESGHLILLGYKDFVPGHHWEEDFMLPPEGFLQLKEKIEINAVKRVALDTVLPWISVRNYDRIAEHVYSFVRAFDRMGVTTLFTIPKPVSAMAFRLKNALEDVVPVSIALSTDSATGKNVMMVNKYLGEKKMMANREYVILPKEGIRDAAGAPPPSTPPRHHESRRAPAGSFAAVLTPDKEQTPPQKSDLSLWRAMLSRDRSKEQTPPTKSDLSPSPETQKNIRFSNCISLSE